MTKETENKLTLKAAICEFKKKDIAILKDKDNPFYKSKYADLSSILGSVEAEMATVGLLITSVIKYHDTHLVLETTLEHKDDDEKIVSVFPVFGGKPQEIGSSVTYARRYNIQSLLNLAAEDDDGNATQSAKPVKKPEPVFDANAMFKDLLENVVQKAVTAEAMDSNWKVRSADINKLKANDERLYNSLVEYGKQRKQQITQPAAE